MVAVMWHVTGDNNLILRFLRLWKLCPVSLVDMYGGHVKTYLLLDSWLEH